MGDAGSWPVSGGMVSEEAGGAGSLSRGAIGRQIGDGGLDLGQYLRSTPPPGRGKSWKRSGSGSCSHRHDAGRRGCRAGAAPHPACVLRLHRTCHCDRRRRGHLVVVGQPRPRSGARPDVRLDPASRWSISASIVSWFGCGMIRSASATLPTGSKPISTMPAIICRAASRGCCGRPNSRHTPVYGWFTEGFRDA